MLAVKVVTGRRQRSQTRTHWTSRHRVVEWTPFGHRLVGQRLALKQYLCLMKRLSDNCGHNLVTILVNTLDYSDWPPLETNRPYQSI